MWSCRSEAVSLQSRGVCLACPATITTGRLGISNAIRTVLRLPSLLSHTQGVSCNCRCVLEALAKQLGYSDRAAYVRTFAWTIVSQWFSGKEGQPARSLQELFSIQARQMLCKSAHSFVAGNWDCSGWQRVSRMQHLTFILQALLSKSSRSTWQQRHAFCKAYVNCLVPVLVLQQKDEGLTALAAASGSRLHDCFVTDC